MEYSLTGAATATGSSKSKIHRMIKDGRLSARRQDDGSYRIDASELGRVFSSELAEPVPRDAVRHRETATEPTGTPVGTNIAVLRLKVEMLEAQITREREDRDQERETSRDTIGDLRKRLDRAEERILTLTHQPAPAAPEKAQEAPAAVLMAPEPSERSKGFLARLFGQR